MCARCPNQSTKMSFWSRAIWKWRVERSGTPCGVDSSGNCLVRCCLGIFGRKICLRQFLLPVLKSEVTTASRENEQASNVGKWLERVGGFLWSEM